MTALDVAQRPDTQREMSSYAGSVLPNSATGTPWMLAYGHLVWSIGAEYGGTMSTL
jgi:hypothetical protein